MADVLVDKLKLSGHKAATTTPTAYN